MIQSFPLLSPQCIAQAKQSVGFLCWLTNTCCRSLIAVCAFTACNSIYAAETAVNGNDEDDDDDDDAEHASN